MSSRSTIVLGTALVLLFSGSIAFAKTDKEFLSDVVQANLAEISVGELAVKNGKSEDVRSYGQMLVTDHSAANAKATALAIKHDVTAPTEPKADAKEMHDKLAQLSGDAFDKEFAKDMVEGHKKVIKEFEEQANGSGDVANFAKETLPTLQKHLETVQSLSAGKAAQN